MDTNQIYAVEHNGDCFQSVFPKGEAYKSQLHSTIEDALCYMVLECEVDPKIIQVIIH